MMISLLKVIQADNLFLEDQNERNDSQRSQ